MAHRATVLDGTGRQGGHVVEMQRRRLMLAIGEVVAKSGLEAATAGRVCEQAGVSRRTFYELFADREACLLAAFDQAIEQIAQKLMPTYLGEGRWRERVRDALSLLLAYLDAEPDVARLCIVEAPRAAAEVLERRRGVLEVLATAVDEGRTESRAGSEPPPLTAQGVVGGALSVIHARLLAGPRPGGCPPPAIGGPHKGEQTPGEQAPGSAPGTLVELTGPLMAMLAHPYLGPTAARKELERPTPIAPRPAPRNGADPFKGLPIRFTYRTARVLSTIASEGGRGSYPSNRHIADRAGIADEGQMSRLLRRLSQCGLIENQGEGHTRGEPNAWALTERGEAIHASIAVSA